MSGVELPEIVEGLVVRPGDTLVLRLEPGMSMEQFDRFRSMALPEIKERTPGIEVLIVGGGVEQIAVVRGADSAVDAAA